MVFQVANVLAPVLLCVLVGFGLAKIRAPFDSKMVNSLVSDVGYPALILAHLGDRYLAFDAFLDMLLAAVCVVAAFGVIGFGFLKVIGLPPRAFLSPMMFNNVGNIGLPISALAFGDQGLAYSLAFLIVVMVGIFTLGVWLPMGRISFSDLARKPAIYAVILALVLMASDAALPAMIDEAVTILGGLAIPLMLLTLGYTLAGLRVGNLWRGGYLALFHLAMAVGSAFVLVHLFGFQGTARGVFILQCMMPVSVATYLWVEHYVPDQATNVAGFILVSTLLSIVALPLVLSFWI